MDQAKLEAIALRLTHIAKGQAELSDLLALGPKELAAILTLAISKMRVGQNEEATRILRGMVALDDRNPIFHMYLGLALERDADLPGAIDAYTHHLDRLRALDQVSNELCQAHLMRCRAYAMNGALQEAAADLLEAQRFDVGSDVVLKQELQQLERVVGGAR